MGGQRVGGGFDPFGHVAVPENMRRVGLALLPLHVKGVDPPGRLAHLIFSRQRLPPVYVDTRGPECVVQLNRGKRHCGEFFCNSHRREFIGK